MCNQPATTARPPREAGRRPRRTDRRGLSMVEAMVSLSICSALLVASGAAFTASASAVQNNTDFTKAGQTARVTMNQMLIEIRRADSVQCPSTTSASTYFDVIRPDETITPNEVFRRYSYDATNKQLKLQIFYAGNAAGPSYVLANNISAGSFGPPQMGTDANNTTVVQRLPITMTATVGKNAVPLSGSEGPRRALKY